MNAELNLTGTAFLWVAAATCSGVLAAFAIRAIAQYVGRGFVQLNSTTPTERKPGLFEGSEESAGI